MDAYQFGHRKTHNNYRSTVEFLVRIQLGCMLTRAHWDMQESDKNSEDKYKAQTQIGDGTSKRNQHIEDCVIILQDGTKVCMIPWFQGSKAGALTASYTTEQLGLCQDAFLIAHEVMNVDQRRNFPQPAPRGILLGNFRNFVNDHAGTENTRVNGIEAAIQVLTNNADFTVNKVKCTHHKIGLIENEVRKSEKPWMEARLGKAKDKNELSTNCGGAKCASEEREHCRSCSYCLRQHDTRSNSSQ